MMHRSLAFVGDRKGLLDLAAAAAAAADVAAVVAVGGGVGSAGVGSALAE